MKKSKLFIPPQITSLFPSIQPSVFQQFNQSSLSDSNKQPIEKHSTSKSTVHTPFVRLPDTSHAFLIAHISLPFLHSPPNHHRTNHHHSREPQPLQFPQFPHKPTTLSPVILHSNQFYALSGIPKITVIFLKLGGKREEGIVKIVDNFVMRFRFVLNIVIDAHELRFALPHAIQLLRYHVSTFLPGPTNPPRRLGSFETPRRNLTRFPCGPETETARLIQLPPSSNSEWIPT